MSKSKKRLLIISGIVLAIVVGVVLTFNAIVAGIISKKVDNYLATHPVKNYTISYGRVGFNIAGKSARLVNVTLSPKQSYIDSLTSTGYGFLVPDVTIGKLIVSGVDYSNILKGKNINIGKIRIRKLNVTLRKIIGKKTKPNKKNEKKTLIPETVTVRGINSLWIHSFILDKSKVELIDQATGDVIAGSQNIELDLRDFRLLPLKGDSSKFKPDCKEAILTLEKNLFYTPDKLYEIDLGVVAASLKNKKVVITNFKYKPLYSKKAFSKHLKYQQERYDIKVGSIEFYLPDIKSLINNQTILVSNVTVNKAKIGIYRDKLIPFPHFKRPLLPHQALKRMNMVLKIDTVKIKNSEFAYEELTGRNEKPLYVNFKKLSAEITNISNAKHRKYSQSKMKAVLKGRLMGKAPFDMNLVFPMAARNDTMFFSGTIYGKVPFSIFNKASFPAAGISFRDGTLNKLSFKGGANPRFSRGTLTMLYSNVKLDIVKKGKQKSSKFLSWGATTVIRKNNPVNSKPPKTALMSFTRDMEKGFGNFLWKTVFSGIKSTLIGGGNNNSNRGTKKEKKASKKRKRKKHSK